MSKHGQKARKKQMTMAGKPLLLDAAIARKNAILAKAGTVIDPQIDAAIRAKYNIYFS
jgi:trimethylamine--corrinoid protein Co-methyltransferase